MYAVLQKGKAFPTCYILIVLTATVSWESHNCYLTLHHKRQQLRREQVHHEFQNRALLSPWLASQSHSARKDNY